jgi:transposase-like protein
MSARNYPNPEVQPKPERRRFSAETKRRILTEVDQCQHGEIGAVLRREGLYYGQIALWRKERENGTLGNKARGPKANPDRAEMKRLEAENARLKRQLENAEAIIDAQKKLAALVDRLKQEREALK